MIRSPLANPARLRDRAAVFRQGYAGRCRLSIGGGSAEGGAVERHMLGFQLEDLDRFAKEVIPAFRDTRIAAAAQ